MAGGHLSSRGLFWRAGAALLAAFASAIVLSSSASAAPPAPPTPLFVQVASLGPTYSPAQVETWMRRTCAGREIVLQSIGDAAGRLIQPYLDVIAPYLPGGARACFSRAFVGTVDLAWSGPGSKYVEGIQDAAFVQRHVSQASAAARAFVTRYPRTQFGWYLTYEADLNQLYYPSVLAGYRSLLTTEIRMLRAIRPGSVLWSPAFAYPYSAYKNNAAGMSQLRSNLVALFSALARDAGGLQRLALQDFVGGSSCQPAWNRMTAQDAAGWARFLMGLPQRPTIEMNVEQYAVDCTSGKTRPGNGKEIAGRMAVYRGQGVPIGPAWEIRFWMQANGMAL